MRAALDQLEHSVDLLAAVDLGACTPESLGVGTLGVQRCLDRLRGIHARMVVEADQARVWQASGARNMADWLSGKTGTAYGDAVRQLKLGDTLGRSSELSEAVEDGRISAATAEALHDAIANPPPGADPAELVEAVQGAGPKEAREAGERWKQIHATSSAEERARQRWAKRSVRSGRATDGLVTTTVVLPEFESRQVMNAINHCAGEPHQGDDRTTEQRLADGLVTLADAYAKGNVTGGREGTQIIIVADVETFLGNSDEPGITGHGDRIPADVVRHLAENAELRRIMMAGSVVLDFGRTIRFATDDQYRALIARDGGCRMPGCDLPASWCEVDHLDEFELGGLTDLEKLALWCKVHHHFRHRSDVEVLGTASNLRLKLPDGSIIDCPAKSRCRQAAA